ncbi:hypothetical protein GN244_ATG01980 [Phytophthora infestans]|uniref:Uncharacterized protein n=1 Tax=Phytophthora infestans TaxID=4787 RepID=A0A833T946_PHYIN|nr:hypothetical protein GN244_ATG01980 [Phytophthora infestans]KAF4144400.1 hypothetical protein GN958_ATG06410 [Phytophthora infestans]
MPNNFNKKRNAIPLNVPTKTAALKVVVEYFRLFRNGFYPDAPIAERCNPASSLQNNPPYVQTPFFKTVAVPDFLSNGYGIETVLEDWSLISLQLQDHSIELL